MPKIKTHEDFIKEFCEKNKNAKNIEILDTYKGSKIKIKCRCKIDKNIWEVTPTHLLNGRGCPICGEKSRRKKSTQPLQLRRAPEQSRYQAQVSITFS